MRFITRCAIYAVVMLGALATITCREPPEHTCDQVCQETQPGDCAGPSGIVMATEMNEEEPLAVGGSWMCGCPAKNGHLILHLTQRKACSTPRGRTAHDINKRAPSDD